MYRNESKCTSTLVWSILGLVFGILPALFWLFMLVFSIIEGETDEAIVTFSIFFAAAGILFTVLGIRGLSILSAVSAARSVFVKDADGYVPMDAVLKARGKAKGSSLERRIVRALEKGYFEKLAYDSANRMFELSDRINDMNDYRNRFVGKNCPNCGAPLKIKTGVAAVCDRCGQEVEA